MGEFRHRGAKAIRHWRAAAVLAGALLGIALFVVSRDRVEEWWEPVPAEIPRTHSMSYRALTVSLKRTLFKPAEFSYRVNKVIESPIFQSRFDGMIVVQIEGDKLRDYHSGTAVLGRSGYFAIARGDREFWPLGTRSDSQKSGTECCNLFRAKGMTIRDAEDMKLMQSLLNSLFFREFTGKCQQVSPTEWHIHHSTKPSYIEFEVYAGGEPRSFRVVYPKATDS